MSKIYLKRYKAKNGTCFSINNKLCYLFNSKSFQKRFVSKCSKFCRPGFVLNEVSKFNNFYDAWWYLNECKLFDYDGMNFFTNSLCIEVQKVNPKTSKIDDNEKLNTKTEVWLECGDPYFDNDTGDVTTCHNIDYDCGGDTFEEAIINLANIIYKKLDK